MSTAASQPVSEPPLIVVMGVSGCGKSSVGIHIAARLGLPFLEGDTMHPPGNIEKMSSGTPLTDSDREPWLDTIGAALRKSAEAGSGLVVTCSALKRAYRERLRRGAGQPVAFVFLHGSVIVLKARMAARTGHFFPPRLLDSQFATLEDPTGEPGVVVVDIDAPVETIANAAIQGLAAIGLQADRAAKSMPSG